MIRATVGRVAKIGVSPIMLLARAKILQALGLIPKRQRKRDGEVRHIFVSFPYHQLGDCVLMLTLLERAHFIWPNAEIDVAIGAAFAPLVANISYVNKTFAITRPLRSDIGFGIYREFSNLTRTFREQIASRQYDLAISPRWGSLDSYFGAYLAYLTGAPVRCGYSGENDGVRPEVDCLYSVSARGGAFEHESLRYSRLLGRCGFEEADAVSDDISRKKIQALCKIAHKLRSTVVRPVSGKYAVLCPGALFLNKRWSVDRFVAVGKHLHRKFNLQIVVVGSSSEIEICNSLCEMVGYGAVSYAGKTDILKLLDIIAGAEIFLGNDSGASHIAGGLGLKTTVVNAFPSTCLEDIPNSPRRFRPMGAAVEVVQPGKSLPPCKEMCIMNWQHCIQQVQPGNVCTAMDKLMAMDEA
jgi:ADP-heptose:LPS heptosyltransferase